MLYLLGWKESFLLWVMGTLCICQCDCVMLMPAVIKTYTSGQPVNNQFQITTADAKNILGTTFSALSKLSMLHLKPNIHYFVPTTHDSDIIP